MSQTVPSKFNVVSLVAEGRLTEGNAFIAPYAKCENTRSGIQCKCPKCTHSGKKVCGSDGKIYKDLCDLKKRSCEENILVKVVPNGCNGKIADGESTYLFL